MVARIWHGYTTKDNAAIYENLLKTEILPGIAQKHIKGYKGVQLLRREAGDEIEFTTIMWFDSLENIKQFTGSDYETAYVPASARKVLTRFDAKASHAELRHELHYDA